jgi:iron complex outermembrane receptor protein
MNGRTAHRIFLATVSVFGLAAPARAQQSVAPAETGAAVPASAENQPSATAQGDSGAADIVVTGSRIVRAGYNAPTPVTVLQADQLTKTAPSNIPDALNQLPQFQGSISQNAQADTGASKVRSGNYLDIRALGPQRVLILEDGRRVPPTSSNGSTDTNLIPQLLVDRVDVVTGGASAAYGSDAVSGVVNFILNKNFTGLKGNIQSGVSTYGDDSSYKAGLAFGTGFFDNRLHVIASAERYHSDGIDNRASRYTSSGQNIFSQETIGGLGTAASPYFYVGNAKSTTSALGGYIQNGPMAGKQITLDGQIAAYNPGTAIPGRPGYGIGGDGLLTNPLPVTGVPSLTTTQLFGRVSFEFTPDVSAFAEISWNRGESKDQNGRAGTPGTGATIFAGNAYLTPALNAALGPNGSFIVARAFLNWAPNTDVQGSRNTVINAGLQGKFSTFKWEAYYTHGSSSFFTRAYQVDNARFFAAVDAVRDSSGNVVCRVTLTNPGSFPGCVPLSVFGNGPNETNAQNYVRRESVWDTSNKMDLFAANISGEPFSLWAGPVGIALGAEYRHQSLLQTSNSNPAIPVDFTGLRGVNTTNQFVGVNIGVANGSYNVKELYGEIDVPLLKDSVIGSLDANGAARYTDYSTSGSVATWKLGLSYNPIHDLRLRGTVSRDIRAPTLFELFAGKQQTTSPLTDLHTGLSQNVNVISSGNSDLKPEKGLTYTIGAVFSPSFLRGFNVSVDYYNIKIKDAIAQPFTYIQMDDFCEKSGGTSPLCAQVIRPGPYSDHSAANFPTQILLQNLNLARTQTNGLDFEASYRTSIGPGSLSTRLLATRLISYKQQPSSVLPERDYAGNADFIQGFYPLPMPKWRGTMNVDYSVNAFGVGVQERYVGSFHISDIFQYVDNNIKPTFYTDLNLSYDFGKKKNIELYATINNLLNQKGRLFLISPVPGLNIPTSRNVYDIVGRYWTVGAKFKF